MNDADATRPATRRRGPKPRPLVENPEPITADWIDPTDFAEALRLHIRRHGDTYWQLHRAIVRDGEKFDRTTIQNWCAGAKVPRSVKSMRMLARIEERYRLPTGYLAAKLPMNGRALMHNLPGITPAERRRLAWHLPADFDSRSVSEREEILGWVRSVIISGSTEYRRYQSQAMRTRFSLRFPEFATAARSCLSIDGRDPYLNAPPRLAQEVAALVQFKTSTLTRIGERREGVWGEQTAVQKVEHLGLLFGALTASPEGPVAGAGAPWDHLTLALLVFPSVWDWYLGWRERRRGFFTRWESDMLTLGKGLTRRETGWLRQNPAVADALVPIPPLVDSAMVAAAKNDWNGACDDLHRHVSARAKEVARVARVHRDPFEPILPVLEAESPLAEYRRITTEIIERLPDARRHPVAAAEAVRGYLMLRIGLHLGVRQKNLRQLMLCRRGEVPRSERQLETIRRGELRWSDRERRWEVLIPSVAFKNACSSFFGGKPFRLALPDLDDLYPTLEGYIARDRHTLLGDAEDPGTLFVKTVKRTTHDAAYDQNTFYEAWRLVIQRY